MRIIPKISVFGNAAYTTKRYHKSMYVGCPINASKIFSELGCQELVINFIGKDKCTELAKKCLVNLNVPVTVGGFTKNYAEMITLVEHGAEKILFAQESTNFSNQTAEKLAKHVGSQAVTLCLDLVIEDSEIFVTCGENRQSKCGASLLNYENLDIPDYYGEIIINNVISDGSYEFKDANIIYSLFRKLPTNIPILLGGGLVYDNLHREDQISGVIIASDFTLVHKGDVEAVLQNYPLKEAINKR